MIQPSTSEWASPVVVVPKKDGSPRFCVDYRRLSAVTRRDSYPIPRMEDCLDSLGDARVCTTLDCNAGYWKIPMAPEDIPKTAFTCPMGVYEYLKMAFGLTNAPATFQRDLDIIMSGMMLSDTQQLHMAKFTWRDKSGCTSRNSPPKLDVFRWNW